MHQDRNSGFARNNGAPICEKSVQDYGQNFGLALNICSEYLLSHTAIKCSPQYMPPTVY